jgi:hypothetical protein
VFFVALAARCSSDICLDSCALRTFVWNSQFLCIWRHCRLVSAVHMPVAVKTAQYFTGIPKDCPDQRVVMTDYHPFLDRVHFLNKLPLITQVAESTNYHHLTLFGL